MTRRLRRARSVAAVVVGALAWAAVTACNQQTIQTPIRVFDRPSDVALVCVQFDPNANNDLGAYNVRPIGDCDPNVVNSLAINPDKPEPSGFLSGLGSNPPFLPFALALVTQSARGELAFVDTEQKKVVDLDPLTPSFGFIPVGNMPEHVRATGDGCWGVTANTDSCDFGVVNLPLAINVSQTAGAAAADVVHRFVLGVPSADGSSIVRTLRARPTWIEMGLDEQPALHGYEPGGVPGACVDDPKRPARHRFWAALPACQLIVEAQLEGRQDQLTSDGDHVAQIERAVRITKTGAQVITDPNELAAIDCPVECAGVPGQPSTDLALPPPPPATPDDMGALPLPDTQSYPGTIAVDPVGRRLVVGDLYGERLDIVPMDGQGNLGTPRAVTLEHGASGVSVVRVSPRSFAGQFLYAIARDGSVRVVDMDREVECETNPDPRWAAPDLNLQQTPFDNPPLPPDPLPQARRLGCLPLGDPATPPRAPLASSPGIELAPGQVPKDIAFVHVDQPPGSVDTSVAPPNASPGLLVGDFAWIISSDGRGTVVNIFDACPQPNQQDVTKSTSGGSFTPVCSLQNVAPSSMYPHGISNDQTAVQFGHPTALLLDRLSHRIRFGVPRFAAPLSESDTTGSPRVTNSVEPCVTAVSTNTNTPVDGGVAAQGRCDTATLPGLQPEPLPAPFINAAVPGAVDTFPTRVIRFVNPDRVRNEAWSALWEGTLPSTDRPLGDPIVDPSGTAYLVDPGGAWCTRGVLANDKLILRGCAVDSECDQAAQFQCVHDPGAPADIVQGMCLPVDGKTVLPDGQPTPDGKPNSADAWVQRCGKMLRALRKYRITSAKQGAVRVAGEPPTDFLTLAPIYEPEFAEQTIECTPPGPNDPDPCADVTVPSAMAGAPPLTTTCLPDWDGKNRCLVACSGDLDTKCGNDFECARSPAGDFRCMRAPIDQALWQLCMPELQNYEVHVGDSFLVEGSQSGIVIDEAPDPATRECTVPAETPSTAEALRLRQARVPLSAAPACPASLGALDSIPIGALASNVCQFADTKFGARVVHYENPIFNIAVTVPISPATGRVLVPPDGTSITLTITGGSNALIALLGVDVQAQQPRYAAVAPDHQTVYIVDEGKSTTAAGLRGQLLRLYSPTESVDPVFVIR